MSDILANPAVGRGMKWREIVAAAARYRDDHSNITSIEEWRTMRMRKVWSTWPVWRLFAG